MLIHAQKTFAPGVLDGDLQRQLDPLMRGLQPLPSIYYPDFIAANQNERADNTISGSKQENLDHIRNDIRNFKKANQLDKVGPCVYVCLSLYLTKERLFGLLEGY